MNVQEFFDFLQKQRDFEDELRQDRVAIKEYIDALKRYAEKHNQTWEQYLTILAKKAPKQAKALEVLGRRLSRAQTNDLEFFDFLEKQRDIEDEQRQSREAIQEYIYALKRYARKHNQTWKQLLTMLAKRAPKKAKALEVLERRLSSK